MADADELIAAAVAAVRGSDVPATERQLDRLVVGTGGPAAGAAVDGALFGHLARAVERLWPLGWQPVDLVRIVSRRAGTQSVRLVTDLLAAGRRGQADVPTWWDEQLGALGARVWWDDDQGYLSGWAAREGIDRVSALRVAVEVLALVGSLPTIAVLRTPPGARGGARLSRRPGGGTGSRMLDRVRALLAKAESTGFPAEAEALAAKAQELMARHSIDQALLGPDPGGPDGPAGIRIGTDAPYAGAKALLVQEVAAANRCESVWSDDLGFATVLGYPADLEAVELLYTSLLVQATAAMLRGRGERSTGGRRTRGYDESFLNAFALRIGERLRAATEEAGRQAVEATGAERLLPVLASRTDAVRDQLDALFPGVTRHRLAIRDAQGWSSGAAAADRAAMGAVTRPARPVRGRRPGGPAPR